MSDEIIGEILTIGREILDGRVVDTNSVHLALAIKKLGWSPRFGQRVDDDRGRILDAFAIARARSKYIFITGGLGPTQDDITVEIFAEFVGKKLLRHDGAYKKIEAYFKKLNRPFTSVQEKQALFPEGGLPMDNEIGTAPGLHFVDGDRHWFFMPGVPREMKKMFNESVIPCLPKKSGFRMHTWRTQFTSEGELQDRLAPALKQVPATWEVTFRTRFPENHIGLYGEASPLYDKLRAEFGQLLGDDSFSDGENGDEMEEVVVALARKRRVWMSTVESCTGGLVAHRLTNVSGSSEVFHSAMVTYDNRAKVAIGVPETILKNFGAVSAECARALAEGGLKKLERESNGGPALCIATTGIAGPTGGTAEKPVGLCFAALARTGQATETAQINIRVGWEREDYKRAFSQRALDLARRSLTQG